MYRNFADVWDVLIVEPEEPAKKGADRRDALQITVTFKKKTL